MSSALRDLPTLLDLLGITDEGLADVTANDLVVAFQTKGIHELEERRRVRSTCKLQQQHSGMFKLFVGSSLMSIIHFFRFV